MTRHAHKGSGLIKEGKILENQLHLAAGLGLRRHDLRDKNSTLTAASATHDELVAELRNRQGRGAKGKIAAEKLR